MVTKAPQMTADDLLDMPDDGFRYELVRGELRQIPLRETVEGSVAAHIAGSIGGYIRSNGLGSAYIATGFLLASDPDHVRAPDAAFVQRERVEEVGDSPGFFPGPPDVAIEVISPSDLYTDVDEKVSDWLDAGTLAVIVVDPRRRVVKVHRSLTDVVVLAEADTLEVSDVVLGWQMSIKDIFE